MSAADHAYLGDVSPDQLAALVFELASQLHVERTRRMALETLLARQGIIDPAALEGAPELAAQSTDALDQSLRRLFRIVAAQGDPTGPLRAEHL
jgi:hypothetical protein